MTKTKFFTQYTRPPRKGWTSDLDSCTIPVQAKTIRELHEKYTRGTLSSNVVFETRYDEVDAPFDAPLSPDRLHHRDPVDVQSQMETVNQYVENEIDKAKEKVKSYAKKHSKLSEKQAKNATTTTTNDDDDANVTK